MVLNRVRICNKFCIFGAQVVAYGAYVAIKQLTGRTPECFAVSSMDHNLKNIENIPVTTLDEVPEDSLIIVAVTELVQKEVLPYLKQQGYHDIMVLTQHEEHVLMSAYYQSIGKFPLANKKGKMERVDITIYEVRNHRDTLLMNPPRLSYYEKPIQAGAAIAQHFVTDILDNTGQNISEKNKQYCEMTATYWVWKNTSHHWKGIEHYRRHLMVDPGMLDAGVDVILPLPYMCYPNTVAQFRRFVSEDVLQALLKALKHLYPNEYEAYYNIIYGPYQYTYNLV